MADLHDARAELAAAGAAFGRLSLSAPMHVWNAAWSRLLDAQDALSH